MGISSEHPLTIEDVLTLGTSWDIDDYATAFTFTYQSSGTEKRRTYSKAELDAIDERIAKVLVIARAYVDGEALQAVLKSSYKLWTSAQHKLDRGKRIDYVVRIVGAADGSPGMTKLSYHYHALYGHSNGMPVAKGSSVVVIDKEVSLASVEEAFPGFGKAYAIATGLGLSPRETGKFCMLHLGVERHPESLTITSAVQLPDNLGYI